MSRPEFKKRKRHRVPGRGLLTEHMMLKLATELGVRTYPGQTFTMLAKDLGNKIAAQNQQEPQQSAA